MPDIRKRMLVPVSLGLTFFLGFEGGGFQLALLQVAEEFHLSGTLTGVLVAAQFIAITLAPLLAGPIADRAGKKRVLLFAMPVFIAGCFFAAAAWSAAAFMIGVFMIGAGLGACECLVSANITDNFPEQANRYMNMTQCTYSLGAVVSPVLTRYLMDNFSMSWRSPFVMAGIGYAILLPLMALARSAAVRTPERVKVAGSLLKLGKDRFFLTLFVCIFLYVGMETGIAYFADALFTVELLKPEMGAYAISVFWLVMSGSRLLFSFVKADERKTVLWGYGISAFAGLMMIALPDSAVALAGIALTGFAFGPIWPMIMAMGTKRFQETTGLTSSLLMAGGGLGGTLLPIVMGACTDTLGLYWAFGILIMLMIAAILILNFGASPGRRAAEKPQINQ
ncbi:MAG TPA: MFS transporter [Feifaniaceae bacterium]|nr:MFS transporter [Feifaniaceae bacterium]